MTVRIAAKKAPRESAVSAQWGLIGERIASDKELRDAIETVLGFEELSIDADQDHNLFLQLPCDISDKQRAFEEGQKSGLWLAFQDLCDGDHIASRRELLEETKEAEE